MKLRNFAYLLLFFSASAQFGTDNWSDYGSCSAGCGNGYQLRRCLSDSCGGEAIQACNQFPCPVDGGWSDWSPCSASCAGGIQTRTCSNPFPSNGGVVCPGGISQRKCNEQACGSAQDGGWSDWGPCSNYCGDGTKNRTCTNPPPNNGGKNCAGPELMKCFERECTYPIQVKFLITTPFNFSKTDLQTDLNSLRSIVNSDMQDIFLNVSTVSWLQVTTPPVTVYQSTPFPTGLLTTVQLTDLGFARDAPNTPKGAADYFISLVTAQSPYIYTDSRRISNLIDSSYAISVSEVTPPSKFTWQWWMWIPVGVIALAFFALYLCHNRRQRMKKRSRADKELEHVEQQSVGGRSHALHEPLEEDLTDIAYTSSMPSMPYIHKQQSGGVGDTPHTHVHNLHAPEYSRNSQASEASIVTFTSSRSGKKAGISPLAIHPRRFGTVVEEGEDRSPSVEKDEKFPPTLSPPSPKDDDASSPPPLHAPHTPPAAEWQMVWDARYRCHYYYNNHSGESTWVKPAGFKG